VNVDPVAELIYWQRPDGGRVFNGGAIGNGVALYYKDPIFTGLMKNVLANFLGP
jgi:N,N-dimethylformamidase